MHLFQVKALWCNIIQTLIIHFIESTIFENDALKEYMHPFGELVANKQILISDFLTQFSLTIFWNVT